MTTQLKSEFKSPAHVAESAAAPAVVSAAPLIGTWVNTDSTTRDLVKIVIAARGAGITVDAFGACSPSPCVWGVVPGIAYAANVSSSPAVAFSAEYKFSFSHVIIVGFLQGKYLEVETYTQFTDGSGRSNIRYTDQMVKH